MFFQSLKWALIWILSSCTIILHLRGHSATSDPVSHAAAGTFEERRSLMLGALRNFSRLHHNPKVGMPQRLAKLAVMDGNDPEAIAFASRSIQFKDNPQSADDSIYKETFTYPHLARFLYTYGERLSIGEREQLKADLRLRARDLLDHGTENHAIMRIASGYLFAQFFPDITWHDRQGRSYTSAELMAETKALLLRRGRAFYTVGDNEQLSPTYALFNFIPLLNLFDFAKDAEVRALADASLIYHLGMIAANNFEGHLLPPYNRENSPQAQRGTATRAMSSFSQALLWCYWGQNNFSPEELRENDGASLIHVFLSTWRPPDILRKIATDTPSFTLRASLPYFGFWGESTGPEVLRTVYRTPDYALGAGALRFSPDDYYLDYAQFRIVWRSQNPLNYLECGHTYWRSNERTQAWTPSSSPFQQQVVEKNVAIVLFDIPEQDPWIGRGQQRWQSLRDKHSLKLIDFVQCRFPQNLTAMVERNRWFFLKDGDIFLAIRPLAGTVKHLPQFADPSLDGLQALEVSAHRTGFVVEIASRNQHSDFIAFQDQVLQNPLHFDADLLEVSYQSGTQKNLRVRYNRDAFSNTERSGKNALEYIRAYPKVWIGEQSQSYESWPIADSPVVSLRDSILTFTHGAEHLTVNWQNALPVIESR